MEHVVSALELLSMTAIIFFLLKKWFKPRETISIDLDWLYRKGAPLFRFILHKPLAGYEEWVTGAYRSVLIRPAKIIAQWAWNIDTWVVDRIVNATGLLTLLESRVSEIFDVHVVDGTVNGLSTVLDRGSKKLQGLQTGRVQNYMLAMVAGVAVMAALFVFKTF
jgi:multicomponent Na+:H+ antiporter subunit D